MDDVSTTELKAPSCAKNLLELIKAREETMQEQGDHNHQITLAPDCLVGKYYTLLD